MNRPEGGCGFSWPLVDPNEEDQRNLIAHQCRFDAGHLGEHRCACGSRPRDDKPRPPYDYEAPSDDNRDMWRAWDADGIPRWRRRT